ncbi:unnamed protein product [Phytophthora fragariaefolia]|uniref:Unnamed protein product n=1 Tax=Phytophthora fragariaefolia TaxID=1490495 RepID=A0A9W7D4J5_9STRA|nr:unnamed protein product [Phytophthora fragariaefolia]
MNINHASPYYAVQRKLKCCAAALDVGVLCHLIGRRTSTSQKDYAGKAEYTVAVIGEEEKTADIDDLALVPGQIKYVKVLA